MLTIFIQNISHVMLLAITVHGTDGVQVLLINIQKTLFHQCSQDTIKYAEHQVAHIFQCTSHNTTYNSVQWQANVRIPSQERERERQGGREPLK